ncbi:motile sperm domain-containing protein 2-like isoform X1 [Teleopsis dalmanni]|uniref:motile sperm domain-containing protein 2-like isoform X1 n=2 Tax=Teleopsis dalmanni TaxID=139649 RepID=UPI0018CD6148|nr:motile sperm domain-containing protein 2-like isoform X1 [Teleopsis dalmanni]
MKNLPKSIQCRRQVNFSTKFKANQLQSRLIYSTHVHFANSSPTRVPQMLDFRDQHTPQEHDLLRVSPTDTLAFSTTNGNESVLDLTSLTNVPITYKIQTTSPEKFRVRPRCGVLNQGESVTVNILLKPDQTLADGGLKKEKDKFLVMVHPVPSNIDQSEPMTTFWKQVPPNSPNIEEHRLTCVYKGSTDIAQYANNEKSKSNVDQIGKDIVNISDVSNDTSLYKVEHFKSFNASLTYIDFYW